MIVTVEYEVRQETNNQEWLDVWRKRADDALVGEPETSAYQALPSLDHEKNILIFERYENGQQSLDAHVARPAHEELMSEMGDKNMTRRRVMSNFFDEIPDYGWWSRPEQRDASRRAGLLVTLLVTRFADDQARADYIQLTGDHAEYCRSEEPDTLVYSGGIAQRDADRGPEIKAGDLLFVAAFTDEAAANKHNVDLAHQALQPELAKIPRERILVQRYVTSDSGFFWDVR